MRACQAESHSTVVPAQTTRKAEPILAAYKETLPGVPEQVGHARDQAAIYLGGYKSSVVSDAQLIVSELTTNAITHSSSKGKYFTVCITGHITYIHIQVTDLGGLWAGKEVTDELHDHFHGLVLVRALSYDMGITEEDDEGHRTVWARVHVPALAKAFKGCTRRACNALS